MRPSEIRAKDPKEMAKLIEEKQKEIFDLRLKKQTGQLADTSGLRKNRKEIARLYTLLREREEK